VLAEPNFQRNVKLNLHHQRNPEDVSENTTDVQEDV